MEDGAEEGNEEEQVWWEDGDSSSVLFLVMALPSARASAALWQVEAFQGR